MCEEPSVTLWLSVWRCPRCRLVHRDRYPRSCDRFRFANRYATSHARKPAIDRRMPVLSACRRSGPAVNVRAAIAVRTQLALLRQRPGEDGRQGDAKEAARAPLCQAPRRRCVRPDPPGSG